jgi:succinyl-CoA synthetase alpha subunit
LGLLRAALEQSRAIVTLTEAGSAHAAAPNRRRFTESVVRLQRISTPTSGERSGATDAMIEAAKKLTKSYVKHLSEIGFYAQSTLSAMYEVVTNAFEDKDRGEAPGRNDGF